MKRVPQYIHAVPTGSLGYFVGTLVGGDEHLYDVWIIDEFFVTRWSDEYKDATAVDDPVTFALLKQWATREMGDVVDAVDDVVRGVRKVTTALEKVRLS